MLKHLGTIELQTKRLILRRFRQDDAIQMFNNWASDDEVTKYLTWQSHANIEVTKEVLNKWIKDYRNLDSYEWAIELKKTGELIGSINIFNFDDCSNTCELGYCISKKYWGNGLMTEAAKAVIDLAFTNLGIEQIFAYHHVGNPASGRVMEKCGMRYEITLDGIKKDNRGNYVSCKIYSLSIERY